MREDIYDYLINYGFTEEDLSRIKEENDKVYFAILKNITDNIEFLENKGLEKNEVIQVVRKNPYIITAGTRKKQLLDELYNSIFNKGEIKELIIKYPYIYIVNPIELKEVIDYLNNVKLNLKDIINENIDVLSFDLENIKKYLNNRGI